jgi:hypothetical protein
MGFFYYFISPGLTLYSLQLVLKGGKRYRLAVNEVRNGDLSDEGKKLAEFLGVPFETET